MIALWVLIVACIWIEDPNRPKIVAGWDTGYEPWLLQQDISVSVNNICLERLPNDPRANTGSAALAIASDFSKRKRVSQQISWVCTSLHLAVSLF